MNIFKGVNTRVYYTLLVLSIVATFSSFPYLLSLDPLVPNLATQPPFELIMRMVIYAAIFAIIIFVGMKAAKPAGLSLKGLEGLTGNKTVNQAIGSYWLQSLVLGMVFALLVAVLELLCVVLFEISPIQAAIGGSISERIMAVFYDAINVEIVWRLFIMSVFTWIAVKLNKDKKLSSAGMWIVIIVTALLGGLLHLPTLSESGMIDITPRLIVRVLAVSLISNGLFGYLFWKNGLLSAMIAHFAYAFTLFVFLPILLMLA